MDTYFYCVVSDVDYTRTSVAAVTEVCSDGTLLEETEITDVVQCTANISLKTVISGSICVLRGVLAESMFKVYCGILDEMLPILNYLLTIYIIFFSIAFMFGIGDVQPRQAISRLIKVILIYALASNASLFYFYLYEFFIHGLLEGFSLFLFELDEQDITDPSATYAENEAGVFAYIDELFHQVIGDEKLIAFSILIVAFLTTGMGILVSLLILFGILALIQAFFRILITYATAILFLTFALMFAPLFIAFAFFKPTIFLFNGWLGSLISYTIQPLVVLAFIFLIAGVSDVGRAISDLQYRDPSKPEPALSADDNIKIDVDKVNVWDMVFQVVNQETIDFKDLTDKLGEDPSTFIEDLKLAIFYALAFLILNAVMAAFLKQVPSFSRLLGLYEGSASTPIIGEATPESVGNLNKTLPQSTGIYRAEQFFAPMGRTVINKSEGIIGKTIGRALAGVDGPANPGVSKGTVKRK